MLRIISTALAAAALLVTTGAMASAESIEVRLAPVDPVSIDSVLSIGAATTMNEHDAIVAAPSRGKIIAIANADVFCAGDETARKVEIDVDEPGDVMLDFCEAHLERRDVLIKFVPAN